MKTITVQRIEQLMQQEKENPNSFAKKIGITATAVYNLLDGGQPRMTTIKKITAAYPNYTEDWLCGSDAIIINGTDKFELDKLRKENAWLKGIINTLSDQLGKSGTNFLNALAKAGASTKVVSMYASSTRARVRVNA